MVSEFSKHVMKSVRCLPSCTSRIPDRGDDDAPVDEGDKDPFFTVAKHLSDTYLPKSHPSLYHSREENEMFPVSAIK